MEIFKDIKDYEGYYQISNLGNVKSLARKVNPKSKRIIFGQNLILSKTKKGYLRIGLYKNSVSKKFFVHRLVANAFISNNFNKPEVNHIDGNKLNNKVENLEWCTSSENTIHSYKNNLQKDFGRKGRKCLRFSLNGHLLNEYSSITEASLLTGVEISGISACIKGVRKTAGKFIWK